MYENLVTGDTEAYEKGRAFYDEYNAVLDLPAEFYLETVRTVFQEQLLAKGQLHVRGERVDVGAIRTTALLTVEGANDDICAPGQTVAAHDLCRGLPRHKKAHHLQAGAGHYGVFSGRRWEREIYPRLHNVILANDG